MQSTNEELTTVNEELQNRMAELSQTNDDLHNVLTGVDNAVIIVGMDLRMRRYTVAAERLLHLAPGDVGRSVGFLDTFLGTPGIEQKAAEVVQQLSTFSHEILAANKRWYALKITPYKTLDHTIRGALVTLTDIDVRKRAEEITRDVAAYADRFLGAIGHPLLIVDGKLRVAWANGPFLSTFQLTPEETVGSVLTGLGIRQFTDPGLRQHLTNVFASGEIFRNYRMHITVHDGDEREALLGRSQIPASTDTPLALVSIESLRSSPPPSP
jgi:two-component system CheB/CheR fusion protein